MKHMIDVAGLTLHVEERGAGSPPLLLVHGFPLDHTMWRRQIDDLATTFRVIAPDLRGYGASSVTPGTSSMRQFADDLAGLLDALGVVEPIVFCGLSMGGSIGWQFLQHHRPRVRAMIVCDARAAADAPEGVRTREQLAERVRREGTGFLPETLMPRLFAPATFEHQPQTIADTRAVIVNTDPEGVASGALGLGSRPDVTAWLPQVDVPTLLIVGEGDKISTVDEMRSIAEAIPGSEFVVIPGAGHMAPLEQPVLVNEAIRRFLSRV
ncbi:MAG: alpha/beta fold hydrolase [Planctomyces sp.]|nr:alpha/beta fold hydrolase [Planctomyces sp.]